MNWIVPALKIFGRVAASVLGMAATLLQPIVDLLGKIADIIATISGGLPGILKGMDSMIAKAESGAIEKYRSLTVNQNNNVNVNSADEAVDYVNGAEPPVADVFD